MNIPASTDLAATTLHPKSFSVRPSVAALIAALSLISSATAVAQDAASTPAEASSSDTTNLETVVVRARNREERLQDVPVPISVVSGKTLEREGSVTFTDFVNRAAGISLSEQNPRQSSISIRGLGKQGNTEGMEASVGVIVDNVIQGYGAQSWGDWTDIDRVEVLRGPQGTLLGKNTTMGVVNVFTKLPSFKSEHVIEATLGSRNSNILKLSSTGGIQEGVLAYRASVFADHRPGAINNIYDSGQSYFSKGRLGARVQFLLIPSENFNARFILSHQQSDEYSNGSLQRSDPTTYLDGTPRTGSTFSSRIARLNSFNGTNYTPPYGARSVNMDGQQPLDSRQNGLSAELNWNLGSHTLTSITSYSTLGFDARNDNDATPFDVGYNFNTDMNYRQATQEVRLTSLPGEKFDYQVGFFALDSKIVSNTKNQFGEDAGVWFASNAQYTSLNASAPGRQLLRDSLDSVYTRSTVRPSTQSIAAFGQLNYHVNEKTDITLGLRQTHEDRKNDTNKYIVDGGVPIATDDATAQRYYGLNYGALNAAQQAQIANAIAIRNGRIGSLYSGHGQDVSETSTSWLLTPSYKFSRNLMVYASAGYGEKSGVTTFNSTTGESVVLKPETAQNFELGFKSASLGDTLLFNANLFRTEVSDYQQQLQKVDATQPTGYRNELGNVEKVLLQGVEFDSAYNGIKNWSFRLAGAYNDSTYKSFKNATCNAEESATVAATCDFSGKQLSGSSKFAFNFGIGYSTPIGSGYIFRTSLNNAYRTKANVSTALSEYGWQKAYNVTDAAIGIGTYDGKYELTLVAKNLFNTEYSLNNAAWTQQGPITYRPGDYRWLGLTLRVRL